MPRITRAYLEENHADLVEEFRAEGRSEAEREPVSEEARVSSDLVAVIEARGAEEGLAEAKAEAAQSAATAERERILGIMGLPAKGFEQLRGELAADPEITKGEAALRILNAQSERQTTKATAEIDALKADEKALEAPAAGATTDDEQDPVKRQAAFIMNAGKRPETAAQ